MRKSLDATWRYLESAGEKVPRRADGLPFVPDAIPNSDDKELGFSYFKIRLENAEYGNLSIPRTFFGRSSFLRVSFAGSDLTESRMCWNEFADCDFSGADLSRCDMRASVFKRCTFADAKLCRADLRRSTFEDCDFTGADVAGAKIEDEDMDGCAQDYLSDKQCTVVAWQLDEGPEPPGG